MINFKVPKSAQKYIDRIVQRALRLSEHYGAAKCDAVSLEMDLRACHANGCPLDFFKLATASDADFVHDVFGIVRFIDRKTGSIRSNFLPRCAKPQPAAG